MHAIHEAQSNGSSPYALILKNRCAGEWGMLSHVFHLRPLGSPYASHDMSLSLLWSP